MHIAESMRAKLIHRLAPTRLVVTDESHRHQGHAGARPGGESHFRVEVVSDRFRRLGQVARQRLVYEVLADEMAASVHALALATLTPEEDAARGAS